MKVKNMKAVRFHKYGGGPKALYEEDIMQPPHPNEGEVLVKVYATGVTPNEIVTPIKIVAFKSPHIQGA
jgi:NADPH:quinone reductase-like Zn-dependent oxidoreductase